MTNFGTFWSGPLSPLEIACMCSFVDHGHTLTLYSFDSYELPSAIQLKPANQIVQKRYMDRFRTGGQANIAHFADYFRLLLFARTDQIWVDCDVFCISAKQVTGDIILKEPDGSIINCVLSINDEVLLKHAIGLTEAFLDRDVPWAATQNVIRHAFARANYKDAMVDAKLFSPIHVNDWYKLLLPEYLEECLHLCVSANTVHLYNNILQKVGFLKNALPPHGSYLNKLLEESNATQLFNGLYDPETIRMLALNWELRFSGREIGFGALMRQILPSLSRTLSRRRAR